MAMLLAVLHGAALVPEMAADKSASTCLDGVSLLLNGAAFCGVRPLASHGESMGIATRAHGCGARHSCAGGGARRIVMPLKH